MRYDVNISILFPDLPLLDRPAAVVEAGFEAAESWWPFDAAVPGGREVDDFVDAVAAADIELVMLNLDLGDPGLGQHGLLGVASEQQRFRDNLDVVIEIVRRLGCIVVNSHFGNLTKDEPGQPFRTATENLTYAAPRLAEVGALLVVEALNPTDFPRYGLDRTSAAVELAKQASEAGGVPVKILFDLYHVQRGEGDLIARARAHFDDIGHIQVADVPERSRPGTGEIAVDRVLREFDELGYRGYAGLEYHPSADPAATFAWLESGAPPVTPGGPTGCLQ